jgi:hypothetical protein
MSFDSPASKAYVTHVTDPWNFWARIGTGDLFIILPIIIIDEVAKTVWLIQKCLLFFVISDVCVCARARAYIYIYIGKNGK